MYIREKLLSYKNALEYLTSFEKNKVKLGLDRMLPLIDILGIDICNQRFVHVAGTNGKGSTCKFLEQILFSAGYKVGLFNSPYFLTQTDAIRYNDKDITEDEFCEIVSIIQLALCQHKQLEDNVTRFELVTIIALLYFTRVKPDFVILETGLGGIYDSTNIIQNTLIEVITKLSYDHMEFLGNSIESIAYNKAGIIKSKSTVVVAKQTYTCIDSIIDTIAKENNAEVINVKRGRVKSDGEYYSIQIDDIYVSLPLRGLHQTENASNAITVAQVLQKQGFNITNRDIVEGLKSTQWPLRLQKVASNPNIYFDGAHNYDGMYSLCEFVKTNKSENSLSKNIFVIGFLKDKEYLKMVKLIAPLCDTICTVSPNNSRALDAKELTPIFNKFGIESIVFDSINSVIQYVLYVASECDNIYVAGSLYMASDALIEYYRIINK